MDKQDIFDRIDEDIKVQFDKDTYLPEHFDEILSCEAMDEIFLSMEDTLERTLSNNHVKVFYEAMVPSIERMYRRERLDDYLTHLREEHVSEQALERTLNSLMPGLI